MGVAEPEADGGTTIDVGIFSYSLLTYSVKLDEKSARPQPVHPAQSSAQETLRAPSEASPEVSAEQKLTAAAKMGQRELSFMVSSESARIANKLRVDIAQLHVDAFTAGETSNPSAPRLGNERERLLFKLEWLLSYELSCTSASGVHMETEWQTRPPG